MTENREVKSDVFSMLMQEKKYALQVYNVINESHYEDPEVVEIITLEKGISLSVRNDAAIIVDMNLNMYEHQSTYSPNMPLRFLIYYTVTVRERIKNKDIVGRKLVKIPTPKFAVFYNGVENRPAIETFRLSDSFENSVDYPELELTCKMYNINPKSNDELLSRCPVLKQYSEFVERIRYNEANGENAPIEDAIEWCIENDVLKEFLEMNKTEVLKAMTIDMTFERREELFRREEREEGRAEGRTEGECVHLISQIQKKYAKGKSIDVIADELEELVDDIQSYYQLIVEHPDTSAEEIFRMVK